MISVPQESSGTFVLCEDAFEKKRGAGEQI